jgi:small subunit ribosomal protein S7
MQRGKKTTAQRITYNAFNIIQERSNLDPLEVFQQALRNSTPMVEVRPKRVGGATYQVPTELRRGRSEALAMRWLIRGARGRKGMPMRSGLAQELMEAARGEGSAVRRKEELHRMAEANRAFVHYRG